MRQADCPSSGGHCRFAEQANLELQRCALQWEIGVSACLVVYTPMKGCFCSPSSHQVLHAAQRKDVCNVGAQEVGTPDPVVVF